MTTTSSAEGLNQALRLMKTCIGPEGFLASSTNADNYRRIWGRDGVIIGLAALMTDETAMHAAFRSTLETLASYQGPHGEIPSNVAPASGRVSYGGMTGRVDADLWFIIGCGEYWRALGDDAFIEKMLPALEKIRFLLGAWEFNNRGLLYIPATGDWSDEYVHNGYILYDQLLYLQALRTLNRLHSELHGSSDHALNAKQSRLKHLIHDNYWFGADNDLPDDVYHEILFDKGRQAADRCAQRYWMPFFSPHGYGYRFDAFANVLVSLLDVAEPERRRSVDTFIDQEVVPTAIALLPAFWPVIKPKDEDWKDLQVTFSYTFKNRPFEFHNGGLWPMLTGFYVADLARRGRTERAREFLEGIHTANAMPMDDEPWAFAEYINGKKYTPGGTRHQCWSASAAVMGHYALEGRRVFRIDGERDGDGGGRDEKNDSAAQ